MAKYIYSSKESLNGVQNYLNDVNKALSNKGINASTANDISWSSDTMKKAAVGMTAGAGGAAAVMAGAGVAGAGAAGAGAAGAGGLVAGASGVAGSMASGSIVVPALIVALPIVAAAGAIIGGLLMYFRSKEEKERIQNELNLYKDAVKKQNAIVREIEDIKVRMENKDAAYEALYKRYLLLVEMNKKLMEYIRNLEADLKRAKVA